MANGGIADSNDSDKHQTSLQTVKKPKPTRWFIQWEKRLIASFTDIHLDWATTTERSTIQYQTSPRLTFLSEETISTNEEVCYVYKQLGRRRTCRFVYNIAGDTRRLAEHCNYMVHDEMIWYRIIVGLRDSNLSERLQTYPELNFDIKSNNDGSTNRNC